METKCFVRSFLKIATTAFLVLMAGNAFAIENKTRIVAPYWQVDSGSYTFIAVSHASLSGMASSIGITINAFDNTGTAYATAITFTITAGNTQRVFIVPTNKTGINSTDIPTALFLAGTTDFTHGHVRIDPIATRPQDKDLTNFPIGQGAGFRDATMLAYWGSIIIEANTTGFAMEFIGDVGDSASTTGLNANSGTSGLNVGQ